MLKRHLYPIPIVMWSCSLLCSLFLGAAGVMLFPPDAGASALNNAVNLEFEPPNNGAPDESTGAGGR